jgi:hypothetical protein
MVTGLQKYSTFVTTVSAQCKINMVVTQNLYLSSCDGISYRTAGNRHAKLCVGIGHEHDSNFYIKDSLYINNYKYGNGANSWDNLLTNITCSEPVL